MDIRALPELSDEDLIYLGVSEPLQRRKLLQVARALKKSSAQRLKGVQSAAPALQPAKIPAISEVAQQTASATSDTRTVGRGSQQGRCDRPAASAAAGAAAPSLACASGSLRLCSSPLAQEARPKPGLQGCSQLSRPAEAWNTAWQAVQAPSD